MRAQHSLLAGAIAVVVGSCGRSNDSVDDAVSPPPTAATAAPAAPPSPASIPSPTGAPASASEAPTAVRVPIDGLVAFGSAGALVTIVAFTDYECPYSRKAERTLATLREELGDDVRVIIASRPLAIHEHAPAAARAFLAAAEQGRAEAMHTRLFADPSALDDAGLAASARAVGLDVTTFEAARSGKTTAAALARSETLADALGATGTPTFYVNGRRLLGARPYATFRTLVDEELAAAKAMMARGIARENVYAAIMANAPDVKAPPEPKPDTEVHPIDVAGAPLRGPANAPVTIELFSDFECPYCVKLEGTLRTLEEAYPGQIRIAFRHNPLPMHDHARVAAKASMAAERQGKFWPYHDLLLQHRDALDRASLERYATDAGLDLRRFSVDLDDPALEARLAAEERHASRLHVEGTPTAFVNGRRITGAQPLVTWRSMVDRALYR